MFALHYNIYSFGKTFQHTLNICSHNCLKVTCIFVLQQVLNSDIVISLFPWMHFKTTTGYKYSSLEALKSLDAWLDLQMPFVSKLDRINLWVDTHLCGCELPYWAKFKCEFTFWLCLTSIMPALSLTLHQKMGRRRWQLKHSTLVQCMPRW